MEDAPRPFIEHLEELRIRLIKCLVASGLGTAAGFYFTEPVIRFLSGTAGKFIFLQPTEAFMARLKIAFAIGISLALPVILYQLWRFVFTAFSPKIRTALFWILPASYLLFLCGAGMGFFLVVPAGVKFLLSYGSNDLAPMLSIDTYVNFVGILCLVLGGVFQMPLVSFFGAGLGMIRSEWLSKRRHYAVLVIYVASAVLTPGPDPVSAMLLALPSYLLYECSIFTARLAEKFRLGGV